MDGKGVTLGLGYGGSHALMHIGFIEVNRMSFNLPSCSR